MTDPQRELAHRVSGGIEVTLYWNADDNTTSIEVFHTTTEQILHFAVPREHALDAFYHPFVHLQTSSDEHALVTDDRVVSKLDPHRASDE